MDEHTLAGLNALAAGPQTAPSRSSLVRIAVREYVERERQYAIEAGRARWHYRPMRVARVSAAAFRAMSNTTSPNAAIFGLSAPPWT